MTAQRAPLPGKRWHFGHGPIDLVIGADGEPHAVEMAHAAAWERFVEVLPELVAELRLLREPVQERCPLQGVIARRMWQACHPFRSVFITPMAAVAGSVAQEIVQAYERPGVHRAWVNNGGDIALHLAPGTSVRVGLSAEAGEGRSDVPGSPPFDGARAARFRAPRAVQTPAVRLEGRFTVRSSMPVRGVATSGWRGRSFSLGIADSVTVLARSASQADAAATIIANAVDVADSRIVRVPACELKDDTDLRDLPVTVDVPELEAPAVWAALEAGLRRARELQAGGLIFSAALACQGWLVASENDRPKPFARATSPGPLPSPGVAGTANGARAPGWLGSRVRSGIEVSALEQETY